MPGELIRLTWEEIGESPFDHLAEDIYFTVDDRLKKEDIGLRKRMRDHQPRKKGRRSQRAGTAG